jgi:adenylate kinase family enzyme
MKRVLVIGSGGAGKTTFANRLGEILKIEVIHLDSFYWKTGWIETPKDIWIDTVKELIQGESWIMDGNYTGSLDLRLAACDTVIFLNISRLSCIWRVIKRKIIYNNKNRPELANGCNEQLRVEFIKWIWSYPDEVRPKILKKLEKVSDNKKIIHLNNDIEVEDFINRTSLKRR